MVYASRAAGVVVDDLVVEESAVDRVVELVIPD